jgi:hypothetical protein
MEKSFEQIRPISEYREIFRAMNGDEDAMARVSIGEAEAYINADTFSDFLQIKNLPVFEKVLR